MPAPTPATSTGSAASPPRTVVDEGLRPTAAWAFPPATYPEGLAPFTNGYPNRPLMQRCPLVMSWSRGEVTFTTSLSWTCSSRAHPTPQYGQIVSVTVCLV